METDFRNRLGSRDDSICGRDFCSSAGIQYLDKVTSEETTEDYAEDTSYSRLKGNNLNYGTVKVQKFPVMKLVFMD